jgi:hypothetical protein
MYLYEQFLLQLEVGLGFCCKINSCSQYDSLLLVETTESIGGEWEALFLLVELKGAFLTSGHSDREHTFENRDL